MKGASTKYTKENMSFAHFMVALFLVVKLLENIIGSFGVSGGLKL